MPIYEYTCDACGHEFEREQRISEDPVKTCPKCRARKARRLISRTSFLLKGGGWYKDLYSSSKPGKAAGGSDKESKPSAKPKEEKAKPKKEKSPKPGAGSGKKGTSGSQAAA